LRPLLVTADNAAMEAGQPKSDLPKRKRRSYQFSLRGLLLFIAAPSLTLGAMHYATEAWAIGAVSLTLFILLFCAALAVGSRGDRRSFWLGFAVCGGAYLIVTMSFAPEFVERLATSKAVAFLRDQFHPASQYPNYNPRDEIPTPTALMPSQLKYEPGQNIPPWYSNYGEDYEAMTRSFVLIGQCAWALILGSIGGMLAQFAASLSRPQATSESNR
jgi:hypothetical protein